MRRAFTLQMADRREVRDPMFHRIAEAAKVAGLTIDEAAFALNTLLTRLK